jgi:hypothetical protein
MAMAPTTATPSATIAHLVIFASMTGPPRDSTR